MPHLCAVYGCGHNSKRDGEKFKFFRFPSVIYHQGEETRKLTEERRRQWLANINRADFDDKKAEHSRVCSYHFVSGNISSMFVRITTCECNYLPLWLFIGSPSALYDKTNPDWAPTKNMGHTKIVNVKIASDRHSRTKKRGVKRKLAEEAKALEKPSDDQLHDEPEQTEHEIIEPRGKQVNIVYLTSVTDIKVQNATSLQV